MRLYSVELHADIQHPKVREVVMAAMADLMRTYTSVDVGGSYRLRTFEFWLTVPAEDSQEAEGSARRAVLTALNRAELSHTGASLSRSIKDDHFEDVSWASVKPVEAREVLLTADGVELRTA